MSRGSKPGERRGGRKKGTPNKKSVDVKARLDELGCDPLEGMARIAREALDKGDRALAGQMYKELIQYVAPKRKAVEMTGDAGGPIEITWAGELSVIEE